MNSQCQRHSVNFAFEESMGASNRTQTSQTESTAKPQTRRRTISAPLYTLQRLLPPLFVRHRARKTFRFPLRCTVALYHPLNGTEIHEKKSHLCATTHAHLQEAQKQYRNNFDSKLTTIKRGRRRRQHRDISPTVKTHCCCVCQFAEHTDIFFSFFFCLYVEFVIFSYGEREKERKTTVVCVMCKMCCLEECRAQSTAVFRIYAGWPDWVFEVIASVFLV